MYSFEMDDNTETFFLRYSTGNADPVRTHGKQTVHALGAHTEPVSRE